MTAPGTQAQVELMRYGKPYTVEVEVGLLPDESGASPAVSGSTPKTNVLQIEVAPADAKALKRYSGEQGVVVTAVGAGPAANADIRVGDILTTLAGEAVTSVAEFERIVRTLPKDKAFPVRILREDAALFFAVRID